MTTSGSGPSDGVGLRVADEQQLGENDDRLSEVRRQLQRLGEGQLLGPNDFNWRQAGLVRYERTEDQLIVVSGAARHQSPTERIYLISPYSPSDDQVHGLAIQLYERDNEQVTDHYRVHFTDPGRRPIVRMSVDETNNEAQPIIHPEIDLTGQPEPVRTNWSCVGRCLRDVWPRLPWPLRLLCEGACTDCIFGTHVGCPVCVGCLAGYASGCITACS